MDEQNPNTYSPPVEPRTQWGTQAWPQQTPQHWLEPLPGQERHRRPHQRTGAFLAAVVIVSLIAGAAGSALTYMALLYSGRLGDTAALTATAEPSAQPSPAASSQTVILNEQNAITAAADAVSPAVVTINVQSGDATDPFSLPSSGVGSGIIYDSNGWILTNRHVVADATELTVELKDGQQLPGTVYGVDTLTDLAIVKIDQTGLPIARLGDSSQLKPGQTAIVIGSALGTFTNSVTSGVISATGRQLVVSDVVSGERRRLRNLIQTDAAINPGNSGGPLIDSAGNVIGVSTAYAEEAQGIFFAIPINIAKPIMRQAVQGTPLSRPWIGIVYVPVDRNVKEEFDLPIDYGAWISEDTGSGDPPIVKNSPAEEAGLEPGDIVTAIDGKRIDAAQNLDDILSVYQPGDRLTLSVLRAGQTLQLGVTLATRPAGVE
ncbi:MAG: trypsin-like peptidase domain-containing protein [Candidatus Limnocylindrales bacterium]